MHKRKPFFRRVKTIATLEGAVNNLFSIKIFGDIGLQGKFVRYSALAYASRKFTVWLSSSEADRHMAAGRNARTGCR